MNKFWLGLFSGIVLAVMIGLTTAASLDRGIFLALEELWPDLWFRATLADAYLAFLAAYLWVFRRERKPAARALWFVLFMGLGSMGIALYILIRYLPGRPGAPAAPGSQSTAGAAS
jgi:hypothetical protein